MEYLSASDAARELGIKKTTLYAYVSRGLIRSEPAGTRQRTRRYHAGDVRRLKQRQEQRHHPERAVATALDWGAPVLESALTLIESGRLYYRGRDAVLLADTVTFEEVATLLWTGEENGALPALPSTSFAPLAHLAAALPPDRPPVERLAALLPLLGSADLAAYDLRPAAVAQSGHRLLQYAIAIITGRYNLSDSAAGALQAAWLPGQPACRPAINAALILCADHELNASAFTARIVASAGATPYAVVQAGLAALSGVRHGGHTARVAALFREVERPDRALGVLSARLQRGEMIPGFGHPLYAGGDPRARALLEKARHAAPESPIIALADSIVAAARSLINEEPSLDTGLVVVAQALGLPDHAPLTLFATGRLVGWIAHAIEQYETNRMIRPRATYTGALP